MRDYALSRAVSLDEVSGTSFLRRIFRNWVARRAVARLENLDDYLLSDIGVKREDVRWAARLPLTVNAALALEEHSFRQRRKEGAAQICREL
jgi:uncharacterized protein YjiS (DUF1127 family)